MNTPGLIELLEKLVSIPSVNPAHTNDPHISGENLVADFVASWLKARGFEVEWDYDHTDRPNIICTYGPKTAGKTLLFESHLDTVGVSGMVVDPFKTQVRDGRMYGRGTCDTKGPMAAALCTFTPELLNPLIEAGYRVIFAGAMGEEAGNVGAERLVRMGLRADHAVVLEPTELAIVHAHKGALWFEIEVKGVAGHGSNPDCGLNAIRGMTRVVQFLQEEIVRDQNAANNPLLGRPSLNVGSIRGGTAVNVVPDQCTIQVDRRMLPEESRDKILDRIKDFLVRLQKEQIIVSHDIRVMKLGAPFHTSAQSALVTALSASCSSAGVIPKTEGAAWYSDAGPLSTVCSEIAVFGPGSIRQAHTSDEFIDLSSLEAGCEVLKGLLRFLAHKTG